jgi:hypothetical protein
MMVVGMYSLNTQRYEMLVQNRDVRREMEEMAGSVALETIEIIRTREFDQAVVDGLTTGTIADIAMFTFLGGENHFETGHGCSVVGAGWYDCDDIDDFHGMQTAYRPFVIGIDTVFFSVDVDVRYVSDELAPVGYATTNKEVTVSVKDAWGDGSSFINSPVTLTRVLTYSF